MLVLYLFSALFAYLMGYIAGRRISTSPIDCGKIYHRKNEPCR